MSDAAKEYGTALYELAREEKLEELILNEIRSLRDIFVSNPDYIRLLSAPNIDIGDRLASIDAVFAGRINKYLCSFLKVVTERKHSEYIIECLNEYEGLFEDYHSTVEARVSSAVELNESQKNALLKKLRNIAQKNVVMVCHVEPELIAGLRVDMEGRLYEGTVKARMDELKHSINKETL